MNILLTVPKHKLGIAMQRMLKQGKNPCFRIKGLRITIASESSANPGSLYIKNDSWDYIGKISPDGFLKIKHPKLITAEQKMLVMAVIHDPEHTAMTDGIATGVCCCCGRQLTNPLSIELGIGPICRGFWFPPVDTLESDLNLGQDNLVEKETELEEGLSSEEMIDNKSMEHIELTNLELDLGFGMESAISEENNLKPDLDTPYETTEEVKKAVKHLASLPAPLSAVDSLVLSFRELSPDQKVSFITIVILEAVNSNVSN